jgi:hypothetical protein
MGKKRVTGSVLVRRPGGKRLLSRHRCRWWDTDKMDLREIRSGFTDWIFLVQDRDQ